MGSCMQPARAEGAAEGVRQCPPGVDAKRPTAPRSHRNGSEAGATAALQSTRVVSVRHVSPGCEVVVWGPSDVSGQRGRLLSVDVPRGICQVHANGTTATVLLWQVLTHREEVVAYYTPPRGVEVRWFVSPAQPGADAALVRWTQSPDGGKGQADGVRKLSYRPASRALRDERGVGERLPAQEWRRVATLLAPACERAGVGHNLPVREVRQSWWSAGCAVWAQWAQQWHSGSVAVAAANGVCDVVWDEDGTASGAVPPGQLRPWCRLPPPRGGGTTTAPPSGGPPRAAGAPEPNLVSRPTLGFDDLYEQRGKLGEGGFGEVYEVRHRATGQLFAAKVLSVCHGTKDEAREIPSATRAAIAAGTRVQGVAFADLLPPPPPERKDKEAERIRRWLQGRPLSGVVACVLPPGHGPYDGDGMWAGVVLDVPVGTHRGTVGGDEYFEAPPGRGAFILVEHLRPVLPHVVELSHELQHPGLCGLVDWRGGRHAYTSEGRPDWDDEVVYGQDSENYMVCVFELCGGGTLETHLRSLPDSTPAAALEAAAAGVLRSTLKCLQYVHEQGVVHHDLKVSNVLLKAQEPDGACVSEANVALCDLGLSKFFGDPHTGGGTLLWMAPELLMAWRWRPDTQWAEDWVGVGEKCGVSLAALREGPIYDSKVDTFAAGILAFYVVVRGRRHPFHLDGTWTSLPEHEHLLQLASSIADGVRFGSAVWKAVSPECKDLISQLLEPKAAARPSAATALRHPWLSQGSASLPPPPQLSLPQRPPAARSKQPRPAPATAPDGTMGDEALSVLTRMQAVKLRRAAKGAKAPPRAPPRGTVKGLPLPRVLGGPAASSGSVYVPGRRLLPKQPLPPPPAPMPRSGASSRPAHKAPPRPSENASAELAGSPAPLRVTVTSPLTPPAACPPPSLPPQSQVQLPRPATAVSLPRPRDNGTVRRASSAVVASSARVPAESVCTWADARPPSPPVSPPP